MIKMDQSDLCQDIAFYLETKLSADDNYLVKFMSKRMDTFLLTRDAEDVFKFVEIIQLYCEQVIKSLSFKGNSLNVQEDQDYLSLHQFLKN